MKLIKSSPYFKEDLTLHDRRISSIMGTMLEGAEDKAFLMSSLDHLPLSQHKGLEISNLTAVKKNLDKTSQLPPLHKSAVKAA